MWIRGLLRKLGVLETIKEDGYLKTVSTSIRIFADNQGVIKLTSNPKYHQKIKHILIKYYKSQELVKDGLIIFDWVPTQEMVADGLTKLLDTTKFREFVSMIGMIDI